MTTSFPPRRSSERQSLNSWPKRPVPPTGSAGGFALQTPTSKDKFLVYRIVVAGAPGNVGREVLAILAEREFPIAELAAVASSRSQGEEIEIGDTGRTVKCQNIENFDWAGWDMAIFAIGSDATAIHAPRAAAAGCTVIDNSSLYRMDPDEPQNG